MHLAPAISQWPDLRWAMTYDLEQVSAFVHPGRGVFFNQAEADIFVQALVDHADAWQAQEDVVENLRQVFINDCPLSFASYNQSSPRRANFVANVLRESLSKNGSPAIFPGGSTSPSSLLDVGCGSGEITSRLSSHWAMEPSSVIGLDIWKPEDIPANISFKQMEPDSLPGDVLSQRFDLIVIAHVLHHATRPQKLLSHAAQALSPGGYMIILEHDAGPGMTPFLKLIHVLYELVFLEEPQPLENSHLYEDFSYWSGLVRELGLQVRPDSGDYSGSFLNPTNNGTLVCRKPF